MQETILIIIIVLGMYVLIATMMGILRNLNSFKEENMTKEEAINKLAHIIFDAAKGGSIPFNVDGEYCAMSVARAKINEFLSPSSNITELPMPNLDDAAIEEPEVDLEKEIKRFTMSKELYEADSAIKAVAEHFYELGLRAQKGE